MGVGVLGVGFVGNERSWGWELELKCVRKSLSSGSLLLGRGDNLPGCLMAKSSPARNARFCHRCFWRYGNAIGFQ